MCYSNLQYLHNKSISCVDLAATDRFATEECPLKQPKPLDNPMPMLLSNGDYMLPSTTGEMPNLP